MDRMSTREAYGLTISDLANSNENIVALDGDLAKATKSSTFAKFHPNKFFNIGIAEQDLIGTSVGLASCGKIPFASSIAMFIVGRGFEQIRNSVGYPHLNVKIVGSHSGLTAQEDGATHQCLEDLALMRSIPGMTVFSPADAVQTKWVVNEALKIEGPVYIRLTRPDITSVYDVNHEFEFGKGIKHGNGTDIGIFTTGIMLGEALKAQELLEQKGINATIIDIPVIKPIDKDIIIKTAKNVKMMYSLEDHNIIGGLGSSISEVLCEFYPSKLIRLGMNDTYGRSGKWRDLLRYYDLDSEGIVKQILKGKN